MENILHIDMDAFYASVEENDKPEYKNKPLVVVGDTNNRSVVSTANYAARKYKIFSAMPLKTALNRCPSLFVHKADFSKYSKISNRIFNILQKYAPDIEQASIDEFYVDVKGSHLLFGSSEEIAGKMKKDIYAHLKLTCSIGISYNKLLAKIASDLHKPDGLTIINKKNFNNIFENLKIEKIPGIGEKTARIFHNKNIYLIKDLKGLSLSELKRLTGMNGYYLYNAVRGIGENKLTPHHEIKSISNEVTLEYDTTDFNHIKRLILDLSEKVGRRLRKKNFKGKTIRLKLRYFDFKTITRQVTLKKYTNTTEEIYKYSMELVKDLIHRQVRLIGIGIGSLYSEKDNKQLKLFEEDDKECRFETEIDSLNERFKNKIKRASLL